MAKRTKRFGIPWMSFLPIHVRSIRTQCSGGASAWPDGSSKCKSPPLE